ncbi:hypothetical protein ACFFUS_07070 [Vibrio gallaecicus]|uniref:Uncharacterized protein n=2 Tax=Vibrio gallaecicus TaxID=552386 RepID=A0ABV4N8M9_9VIBR|nr:hypothetical protein [Vibrio gallaecicus]MDN3616119.1 hypothetical protein [Vibrio gallaecicus]
MEMNTIKYQVMGCGKWISATVSRIVALKLAAEYESYGWPVEVCSADMPIEVDQNAA